MAPSPALRPTGLRVPPKFARFCVLIRIIAVVAGLSVSAQAQIIQTIAGGSNPSTSPSENACVPLGAVATQGTDVYVASCDQIFKVSSVGQSTHVAGSGRIGFSPNGTPAATADLGGARSLFVDASGNIYFFDSFNFRVREIVASTGQIKTVAGTGTPGFNGDGILASNAEIAISASGQAIFVDAAGDVFIADAGNRRVREIVATTGMIQTVAGNGTFGSGGDGGPATSAQLERPRGVFLDGSGNIFIADATGFRIREVLKSTGVIETVAGNGTGGFSGDQGVATAAQLSLPSGVSVDGSGNIFIADTGNDRIREVVGGAGGNIVTVAGSGGFLESGCNGGVNACLGVGGPASTATVPAPFEVVLDAAGDVLMPINTVSLIAIEEVVASTGKLAIFAANGAQDFTGVNGPALNAQLNEPAFVAPDAAGNIYVADAGNNVVYEIVAASGILKLVAGTGVAGYTGDGGPATSAEISIPFSVVADGSGNLFIADAGNNVIREVVAATGTIKTVAGSAAAACSFTGTVGDGGTATSASLCFPTFAFVDASGNIFIADNSDSLIREVVAATGNIQTVAGSGGGNGFGYSGDGGPATSALLDGPSGVFVDASGNIFIADTFNNAIREVVAATGNIQTIAGSGNPGFSGDGGPATSARLDEPETVLGDSSGNLFVSDLFNNAIREFTVGGNIQTVAGDRIFGAAGDGGPATSAEINTPNGAFVEPSGSLLIADTGNGRVRLVGLPTTTSLGASANPAVAGQVLTLTATVSPSGGTGKPTGFVQFSDGATVLGSSAVNGNGQATFDTSSLTVGMHSITAQYVGTNFPGSTSSTLMETIGNLGTTASTTTLTSSLNPSVGGTAVTFTASVAGSGGTPSGTINFLDGTTSIGSGTLNGGQATVNISALTVGSHSITAQYTGDTTFAPSTSAALSQTVSAAVIAPASGTTPTVTAGQSVNIPLVLTQASGSNLSFTLACSSLPANSSCSFNPNPVTPGPPPNGTTVQLTFTTQAAANSAPVPPQGNPVEMVHGLFAFTALVGMLGAVAFGYAPRRRLAWGTVAAVIVLSAAIAGCSTKTTSGTPSGPGSGGTPTGATTFTVTATSGSTVVTTKVNVTVTK